MNDPDILHARQQAARQVDAELDRLYRLRERQAECVHRYQECIADGEREMAERHEGERRGLRDAEQPLAIQIAASVIERVAIAVMADPGALAEILAPIIDRRIKEARS